METPINTSLTSALLPALPPVSGGSSGTTQLASGTGSGTQVLAFGFNTLTGSNSFTPTLPTVIDCGFTGSQTFGLQPLDEPTVHYFPRTPAPANTSFVIIGALTKPLAEESPDITVLPFPCRVHPPRSALTAGAFVGTTLSAWKLSEVAARISVLRSAWDSPDMLPEYTSGQPIFDAIQALYLSYNAPRDRQIAGRLTTLYRATLEEDEVIRPASVGQFKNFFLAHPELGLPKITLTPDGTLRARWIHGKGNFVALEFTGEPNAKIVAEIPRDKGLTATHFGSEPLTNIIPIAQGMGASFA
jgi:hypothetical protein